MVTWRYLVVAIVVTGCGGPEPQPDPEPVEEPTVLGSDAAAALTHCRKKMETIDDQPIDSRIPYAVESCRGLWLEEGCSQAFAEALERPHHERAGHIMRACQADYCPKLDGTFAICEASLQGTVSLLEPLDDPEASDPLEAWRQFNDAIFLEAFGNASDTQVAGSFPSMLLQLIVTAPS